MFLSSHHCNTASSISSTDLIGRVLAGTAAFFTFCFCQQVLVWSSRPYALQSVLACAAAPCACSVVASLILATATAMMIQCQPRGIGLEPKYEEYNLSTGSSTACQNVGLGITLAVELFCVPHTSKMLWRAQRAPSHNVVSGHYLCRYHVASCMCTSSECVSWDIGTHRRAQVTFHRRSAREAYCSGCIFQEPPAVLSVPPCRDHCTVW